MYTESKAPKAQAGKFLPPSARGRANDLKREMWKRNHRQSPEGRREALIKAANAHFTGWLSLITGAEEDEGYDLASVFGEGPRKDDDGDQDDFEHFPDQMRIEKIEAARPESPGCDPRKILDRGEMRELTIKASNLGEGREPEVIHEDHDSVNAALMAAEEKRKRRRRRSQALREAERERPDTAIAGKSGIFGVGPLAADVVDDMKNAPEEEPVERIGVGIEEPALMAEEIKDDPADDEIDDKPVKLADEPELPPLRRREAPMSRAEEAEAIILAYAGDAEAKRRLVACNEGIVRKIAGTFFTNYAGFTFAELAEVGRVAILDCIEARTYDPKRGMRFTTYIEPVIRRAISRYCNAPEVDVGKDSRILREKPVEDEYKTPENPAKKRKSRRGGQQKDRPTLIGVDEFLANGGTVTQIPCGQKRNSKVLDVSKPGQRSARPTIGERLDLAVAQDHREYERT